MSSRLLHALVVAVSVLALVPSPSDETAYAQQLDYRVHHVGARVPDLEAAIEWYGRILGFVVDRRFTIENLKARAAFIKRGDFRIELFEFDGTGPIPEHRRDPVADLRYGGLSHLAIEVTDVRAFAADLEKNGVDFAVPVTEFMPGWPVAFIRDVAGNLIEIYADPK